MWGGCLVPIQYPPGVSRPLSCMRLCCGNECCKWKSFLCCRLGRIRSDSRVQHGLAGPLAHAEGTWRAIPSSQPELSLVGKYNELQESVTSEETLSTTSQEYRSDHSKQPSGLLQLKLVFSSSPPLCFSMSSGKRVTPHWPFKASLNQGQHS